MSSREQKDEELEEEDKRNDENYRNSCISDLQTVVYLIYQYLATKDVIAKDLILRKLKNKVVK